ncbi:MAG: hypothetical protein HXX15_11105 [Rhodopseudomonas sp.]|uniref:hypothetical protein n=1 Tax=Rhodopseudomonas sp. TaxID=1078 RepID=UPI0017CE2840|nr:hypothetical protein [Rhodopseudomonas sp.]NVN86623.1 hypothetical protein [Rhodopseudomonas sp.]
MIMSIKFEEQFKYRDEENLNKATRRLAPDRKNHCAAAIYIGSPDLVYPRFSRNDNHRTNAPVPDATGLWVGQRWEGMRPGDWARGKKTRASANTSGSNLTPR